MDSDDMSLSLTPAVPNAPGHFDAEALRLNSSTARRMMSSPSPAIRTITPSAARCGAIQEVLDESLCQGFGQPRTQILVRG
jgi:hypothetical protein